jgi:F0F1-type ATP synthase assembly protein I
MSNSQEPASGGINRKRYVFNLTLAAVTGQVGCLTALIILIALLVGLWLDSRFDTRPTFTLILLVSSVPITLAAMFWVVKKATSGIKSNADK